MSIRILAVGKKHEAWVAEGIERYERRLRRPFDIEWVLLPHSSKEGLMARQEESQRIRTRLGAGDFIILLDERGATFDSPALSKVLGDALEQAGRVSIIIGGAYGVDDELRRSANKLVSLSALVFPHQLVRLLLVEQLYRAQSIREGSSYHHE